MSFEIVEIDLNGRIGKLHTKSGILETPYFFPVINKNKLVISIEELKEEFHVKGIMTNSYLLKKEYERINKELEDIHKILNFDGVIYTDSGGFQILKYGKIEARPEEIVEAEEKLNVDIGTILDVPTGIEKDYKKAYETVQVTIKNAETSIKKMKRRDILWVGPIQGGLFEDLIRASAKEMMKKNFDILALGSPVELMERYEFSELIRMGITAKSSVPSGIPMHFFGAGHPMILGFLVAIGYDIFDSASYALYAYDNRYITENGTLRLEEIEYFPCNCKICNKYTPKELKEMNKEDRIKIIAKHNLYSILKEINEVKQRIKEGTLWDLLEIRSKAHPSLFAAFKELKKNSTKIFNYSPVFKSKGIFVFDDDSKRPEITFAKERLEQIREKGNKIIILFVNEEKITNKLEAIVESLRDNIETSIVYYYNRVFGFMPLWLCHTTPFDKVITKQEDSETFDKHINNLIHKVKELNIKEIEIIRDESNYQLSETFIAKFSSSVGIKIERKIELK